MKILKFIILAILILTMMCLCGCTHNTDDEMPIEVSEDFVEPTPIVLDIEDTSDEVSEEIELPIDMPGVTVERGAEPMYDEEDILQEITIVDNEALSAVVISLDDDIDDQYTFHIHAESLSTNNIVLTLKNVKVNSFEIDPNWSCTITPTNNINANVNIVKNIITEYAINHVSTVEFTFGICDPDGANHYDDVTCHYDIEDIILE